MSFVTEFLDSESVQVLWLLGLIVILPFLLSLPAQKARIPKIVSYMVTGILLGPSVWEVLDDSTLDHLEFVTQMALGLVAFKIGLEIDLSELKEKGTGILITTVTESLLAVAVVAGLIYTWTGDFALSLIFGALAPASAPAGTMAVIDETRSSGPLTGTLFSVVGIDDGLGIIIFGVLFPVATFSLSQPDSGLALSSEFLYAMHKPFLEIFFSILAGALFALFFVFLTRFSSVRRELLLLTFGTVVLLSGLSQITETSLVLSNIIFGLLVGNLPRNEHIKQYEEEDVGFILPLVYLLFFTIAGANLHIGSLPAMGMVGVLYIVGRSGGLVSGAFFGAWLGGLNKKIRKYLGWGILSQAGVAIGLALIVKQELAGLGPAMEGQSTTRGDYAGGVVFTVITATSVFFELFGPFTARWALHRAGETGQAEPVKQDSD